MPGSRCPLESTVQERPTEAVGQGGAGAVAVRVQAAQEGVLRDWNQGPLTMGSARIKDLRKRTRAESGSKVGRDNERLGGKG